MQDLGVREEYFVWECYDTSSPPFYLDLVIYAYLAVLQVVGIILAFQTRNVKILILNDSKFVAAIVYLSSTVLVVFLIVAYALRKNINISSAITSGGILLLATIFLGLIFIPKVCHSIYTLQK